jgi:hypothetical protein
MFYLHPALVWHVLCDSTHPPTVLLKISIVSVNLMENVQQGTETIRIATAIVTRRVVRRREGLWVVGKRICTSRTNTEWK